MNVRFSQLSTRAPRLLRITGLAFIVALVLTGVLRHTVNAQSTITYTDTAPSLIFQGPAANLTFSQFDPSVGVLTGVEVSLSGDVSGTLGYENVNGAVNTFNIEYEVDLTVDLPNAATATANGMVAEMLPNVPAFDGALDYGGASGGQRPVSVPLANTVQFTDTPTLALFAGAGAISLPVAATSAFTVTGQGPAVAQFNTSAAAAGTVRYTYVVANIQIKKYTNGVDADTLTGPLIHVGDPITWSYVVRNIGTAPLPTVDVSDSDASVSPAYVSGDANANTILDVGEEWHYTASGVAAAGQYSNTGAVTASTPNVSGPDLVVTDADLSHYFGIDPHIAVQKTASATQIAAGDVVTYSYDVSNIGNIYLLNAEVTDDQCAPVTPRVSGGFNVGDLNQDSNLDLSEIWRYTCTTQINQDTTNVVTVNALDPTEVPVPPAQDSAFVDVLPVIALTKSAAPAALPEPSGLFTFTVQVQNQSSEPVTLTSLVDDVHGDLNGQGACILPQLLAIGGVYECTFSATVTGNAGDIEIDTITATAHDNENNVATAQDSAQVSFTDLPSEIAVIKSADQTLIPKTGADVAYTVTVANLSAADVVTITSLIDSAFGDLTDRANLPNSNCTAPQVLNVGGRYTCLFTAFVTATTPISETHYNVVTATGVDDDGNPLSNADDATVPFDDPLLVALKTDALQNDADGSGNLSVGDTLRYTIRVTNRGPVEAVDVVLEDSLMPGVTLLAGSLTTSQGVIVAGSSSGDAVVTINLGVLPGNNSEAVVQFDVVIANINLATNPCITNQATVIHRAVGAPSGQAVVQTDDPDTPLNGDATVSCIPTGLDDGDEPGGGQLDRPLYLPVVMR
ncbi:MAG: choice-of-anchor E domain-containing protein [Caldilineaceae bacterium]|nr:choice-of-anchor E domain-containing protein [Caldilineaceae bacterium]